MLTLAAVLAIFVYGIIAAMLGTILPDLSKRFNLTPETERKHRHGASHRPDDRRRCSSVR